MKVLVIQTAFLGDVVLLTPLLEVLKLKGYPTVALVTPQGGEILQHHPCLDKIIIYDKRGKEKGVRRFLKKLKEIKRENFKIALVPHPSLRSALLAYFAGIPHRIGFSTNAGSFLFTHRLPYPQVHEIERNLSLLKPLGFEFPPRPPALFLSAEEKERAKEILEGEGCNLKEDTLVGIAPGSIWATKRWGEEKFARVGDRLIRECGVKVLLLGGEKDLRVCKGVEAKMKEKPISLGGKTTIRELISLIDRCRILLTNDSGPMHIATARKIPVVTIFGPTTPELGFAPYGKEVIILEKPLPCRPCGKHGGEKCPLGTHRCMEEIKVEEVFSAIKNFLDER